MSAWDESETATFACTTARGAWPPPGVAEVLPRSTRPRTSRSCQSFPTPQQMTRGVPCGSLGRILAIRLPSVHLVAHFFHLTKNAKSVGSENLFDVRRAIAAIE